jgi:hypothetical protein
MKKAVGVPREASGLTTPQNLKEINFSFFLGVMAILNPNPQHVVPQYAVGRF